MDQSHVAYLGIFSVSAHSRAVPPAPTSSLCPFQLPTMTVLRPQTSLLQNDRNGVVNTEHTPTTIRAVSRSVDPNDAGARHQKSTATASRHS